MSIPMSSTRLPSNAMEMARLLLIKDLPSPLILDVTSMTFSSLLLRTNCMLLRIRRKSSAIELFSPSRMTIWSLFLCVQISPRTGSEVRASSSFRLENFVRNKSLRYRYIMGNIAPMRRPTNKVMILGVLIGSLRL